MAEDNKNTNEQENLGAGAFIKGEPGEQMTIDFEALAAAQDERDANRDKKYQRLHDFYNDLVRGADLTSEDVAEDEQQQSEIGEDTHSYNREMGFGEGVYFDAPVDDKGTREYKGSMGSFRYDSKQFQIQQMTVLMPDQTERSVEVLKYIGQETDGSKIHIPQGCVDMTGMFAGTNIRTAPDIPKGVKNMDCAFLNCKNLELATFRVPPSVENMNCTFAGCSKLRRGPDIPGTVKNADYAFAQAVSLQNPPRLGAGIESMEGMFIDCRSLRTAPHIPSTVKKSRYVTANCDKLDAAQDEKNKKNLDVAREEYREKLTRKKSGNLIGRAIASGFQYAAARRMGFGAMASIYAVHQFHQSGTVPNNIRGAMGMWMMNTNAFMGRMLITSAKSAADREEARRQRNIERKMAEWDSAHNVYTEGLRDVRKLFKRCDVNGNRDAKKDVFLRMDNMSGSQLNLYRETHGRSEAYITQADTVKDALQANLFTEDTRRQVAAWYKEQLAGYVMYYKDAQAGIAAKNYSEKKNNIALSNLDYMRDIQTEPLVRSIQDLQETCLQRRVQLFNEGDMRDMDNMMRSMNMEPLFAGNMPSAQYQVRMRPVEPSRGQQNTEPQQDRTSSESHAARVREAYDKFGHVANGSSGPNRENDGPDVS